MATRTDIHRPKNLVTEDRDETFGFFRRPTKAAIVAQVIAR